ncbi:extended synaptotagmin-2 [Staphylotrichum tortipilum]|uniref:Extended synaptotagmin-2 n=1 Tax=Staphylotrichum tortipilum TaxID=2831512 RepID=A0AAN6MAT4_9PEZI|nr:extended synaptotagmin-2 [Staphylotrichum longicolle]
MSAIVEALTASGGPESPGFLNDLVKQLWPNIAVAGACMIKGIAEPMFTVTLPAPLNSLVFEKIDLGTVPMHFSKVDVHKTENEGIKLDLDLDWDGECDIELNGNMIPKIGVEHVKLRGRLSILLCPLTDVLPLIGAAQVTFINPPYLKLTFTDAAHIANLSVIDKAIRKVILSIISSLAVLPNRFLVKLDPTVDFFKTYQPPLGVLRLTIESGSELGENHEGDGGSGGVGGLFKRLGLRDVPDCYVKVNLSAEAEWRTGTAKNTRHPEWNEAADFVVCDYDQSIAVDVNDEDTARKDDDIGVGVITVKQLLLRDDGRQELRLTHQEEATNGRLAIRGQFFKFVPDASSLEGGGGGGESEIVGLLTVLVASAFGIRGKRQELKPSVKVTWGEQIFRTAVKSDAPGVDIENPSFDQAFRVALRPGMIPGPPVKITLLDGEVETGAVEVALEDVLTSEELTLQKFFDVGEGATVRAGLWLRGTTPLE